MPFRHIAKRQRCDDDVDRASKVIRLQSSPCPQVSQHEASAASSKIKTEPGVIVAPQQIIKREPGPVEAPRQAIARSPSQASRQVIKREPGLVDASHQAVVREARPPETPPHTVKREPGLPETAQQIVVREPSPAVIPQQVVKQEPGLVHAPQQAIVRTPTPSHPVQQVIKQEPGLVDALQQAIVRTPAPSHPVQQVIKREPGLIDGAVQRELGSLATLRQPSASVISSVEIATPNAIRSAHPHATAAAQSQPPQSISAAANTLVRGSTAPANDAPQAAAASTNTTRIIPTNEMMDRTHFMLSQLPANDLHRFIFSSVVQDLSGSLFAQLCAIHCTRPIEQHQMPMQQATPARPPPRDLDFNHLSRKAWHAINTTYARLRDSQQFEHSHDVQATVSGCISTIRKQCHDDASFRTRLSGLETLRKIGKTMVLSDGIMGHELRNHGDDDLPEAMLYILQGMSADECRFAAGNFSEPGKPSLREKVRWLCPQWKRTWMVGEDLMDEVLALLGG